MSASDDWAHNTSMQRATGSDVALPITPATAQMGTQSALSQLQSQAEPALAQGASTLNDVAAGVLGALT